MTQTRDRAVLSGIVGLTPSATDLQFPSGCLLGHSYESDDEDDIASDDDPSGVAPNSPPEVGENQS